MRFSVVGGRILYVFNSGARIDVEVDVELGLKEMADCE